MAQCRKARQLSLAGFLCFLAARSLCLWPRRAGNLWGGKRRAGAHSRQKAFAFRISHALELESRYLLKTQPHEKE